MLLFNTINDVQLHFATPVLHKIWPAAAEHNAKLKELIVQKSKAVDSRAISNRGGWQSKDDFLEWGGESIAALSQWIQTCVLHIYQTYHRERFMEYLQTPGVAIKMRAKGWANINKKGDWNAAHNHYGSNWSGVYYVQAPPKSGQLALLDPRPNIDMMDTGIEVLDMFRQIPRTIDPQEGLTVIFPSWLQHQVSTHEADLERISIAFNIKFVTG